MDCPNILLSASADGWGTYENTVRRAGGTVSGGYCPAVDAACDGLLLCGGGDMDPALFGQADAGSEGIDRARDAAELALTRAFLAAGKPIWGICRGHQVLNVVLGGTLIQDMGPERNLFHRRTPGVLRVHPKRRSGRELERKLCQVIHFPPGIPGGFQGKPTKAGAASAESPDAQTFRILSTDKVHAVRTAEGSLLRRLYGPVFSANSSHHQAVGRLGDGLTATAWSESGVVEGLEHTRLPVVGVQFHPERMACDRRRPDTIDGGFLFEWFLRRCRGDA